VTSDPARASVEPIVPKGPPTVEVADGAGLVAIVEPDRIAVATLPDLGLRCEIGVDPEAAGSDAVFVGRERLLVTSRFTSHTIAYLIDPNGPRKLAELRIESPIYLLAASDDRVMVTSSLGTAVLSAVDDQLDIARLPIRSEPSCAVGIEGGRFLVSVSGTFEEWDAATRAPVRRFKLSRPQQIRTVGYGAQHLWWVASSDPTRIEVLPVSGRGQSRVHVLPEAIAKAVGHRDIGAVLAIGADSRHVYVDDVSGGGPSVQLACGAAADVALAVDRKVAAVVVAQGQPIELVALDVHARPAPVTAPADDETEVTVSDEGGEQPDTDVEVPASTSTAEAPAAASLTAGTPAASRASTPSDPTVARRLLEWRDRMRTAARPIWQRGAEPTPSAPSWRDELVLWGRGVASGLHREPPPRASGSPLAQLGRLDIPDELMPGVALAYAMHLAGTRGVAPADLAALFEHRWDEALGRGVLAASGVLRWRASRAVLAPAVTAFLDERPPVTGFVLGTSSDRIPSQPAAVVASAHALDIVAGRCTALVGAVLLPRPHATATAIRLEARLRLAVPLVEGDVWPAYHDLGAPLVRVTSAEVAAAMSLPVIATVADD
jgi:hypothetical protein